MYGRKSVAITTIGILGRRFDAQLLADGLDVGIFDPFGGIGYSFKIEGISMIVLDALRNI